MMSLQVNNNILDYILQQTGARPKRQGDKVLLNPCPICGHKDHLHVYLKTNSYYSFSGCCKGGSLVDWMMEYEGLSLSEAMKRVHGDSPPPDMRRKKELDKLASLLNEKVEGFFNTIIKKYKAFIRFEESFKRLNIPVENSCYRWIKHGVAFYDRLTEEFIQGDYSKRVKLMQNYDKEYFLKLAPKGADAFE